MNDIFINLEKLEPCTCGGEKMEWHQPNFTVTTTFNSNTTYSKPNPYVRCSICHAEHPVMSRLVSLFLYGKENSLRLTTPVRVDGSMEPDSEFFLMLLEGLGMELPDGGYAVMPESDRVWKILVASKDGMETIFARLF